ncbi:hypothetical protein [Frigoribacterium sp. CFBP 13707]|uniref:hypothetical protein n=1 Tax=Frigoribacterium sp. CFBP 13707 TaxID=2775313 RepID=UPI0017850B3B|nr:hypothetical protein [Frigoribacterium sp. CFBP 13707]MBD8729267.1 hypothetical protein [Frigoribacterium sp. CFBP 13707]
MTGTDGGRDPASGQVREARRLMVAGAVCVVVAIVLLLQPQDELPVLGDMSSAARIIGGLGAVFVIRAGIGLWLVRRDRRRRGPDEQT